MASPRLTQLGRRERQIVEAVLQLGRASVADVRNRIEDPPSYSSVRAMMRILEDKGYLRHEQDGPRYVYLPMGAPEKAKRSALRDVVQTLFDGSTSQAVAALIETSDSRMDDAELDKLQELIRLARRQGR